MKGINSEYTHPKFPEITIFEYSRHPVAKDVIKVANIQLETLLSFQVDKPPELSNERKQEEKICKYIDEALAHHADLIILPELSTSKAICEKIGNKYYESDCAIIMGSYYDEETNNISNIIIYGDERPFQIKNNPSNEEKSYMKVNNNIQLFIDTPIGDFAVLICYDATDFSILTALRNFYTDYIICIAYNKDVGLFDHMFRALTYLKYQYIIFCNDAQFGGSTFYAPYHINRSLDTLGVNNEGILYRKLDLKEIEDIRGCRNSHKLFKYPPASTVPRKSIYIDKFRKYDNFYESSFNFLSCPHPIFGEFLSHARETQFQIGFELGERRLESIKSMSSEPLNRISEQLSHSILKEYVKYEIDEMKESEKKYGRTSQVIQSGITLDTNTKVSIANRFNSIHGKKYILFEIDCEKLHGELHDTSLLDEIIDESQNNRNQIVSASKENELNMTEPRRDKPSGN